MIFFNCFIFEFCKYWFEQLILASIFKVLLFQLFKSSSVSRFPRCFVLVFYCSDKFYLLTRNAMLCSNRDDLLHLRCALKISRFSETMSYCDIHKKNCIVYALLGSMKTLQTFYCFKIVYIIRLLKSVTLLLLIHQTCY